MFQNKFWDHIAKEKAWTEIDALPLVCHIQVTTFYNKQTHKENSCSLDYAQCAIPGE